MASFKDEKVDDTSPVLESHLPELSKHTPPPSSHDASEPPRGIFRSWVSAARMEGANDIDRPEAEANLSRFTKVRQVTDQLSKMGVETRG